MNPFQYALAREIFLLITLTVSFCCGQTHYFLRQPAIETVVRLGDVTTLQCAVANMVTSVQWVVNGFAMGPLRDGRYRYAGNKSKGEYNLQINNTQLIDDGIYDCQVLKPKDGKPLRSRFANVTVLVPPKQILLTPVTRGLINAKYPGMVTVTCDVPDTKPAAHIQWRVDGQVFSDVSYAKISAGSEPKLLNTVSSIALSTAKYHDGSLVECIVDHLALDEPVIRRAVLNVLKPPSQPVISGFRPGPMRSGDDLSVQCTSAGGNPAASISWSIGEKVLEGEYNTINNGARNTLRHTLTPADNGKPLKCTVTSPAISTPLQTHVQLEVHYPPESIAIEETPKDGVAEGEEITFICYHTESNPFATLEWYIGEDRLPNKIGGSQGSIQFHTFTPTTGRAGHSIGLRLQAVRREDATLPIKCRARIPEIGYDNVATIRPKVNYAPRKVSITIANPLGLPPININPQDTSLSSVAGERLAYKAGDTILLSCEAKGGLPAPALSWFLENNGQTEELTATRSSNAKVDGETNAGDELITTSTVEINLKPFHNGATVTCKASHSRYQAVTSAKVYLTVAFPPDSLTVTQFPSRSVADKAMSLTCLTASSFPASEITWYRDNVAVNTESVMNVPLANGTHGGFITSCRLKIIPDAKDNGAVYTCRATVASLQQIIDDPYTLTVEYAPSFRRVQKFSYNITENSKLWEINVLVDANPSIVSFEWFRYFPSDAETARLVKVPLVSDSKFEWEPESSVLRIHDVERSDAGVYAVSASNGVGKVEGNITLNVLYASKVIRITKSSESLEEGDSVKMRCEFDSHPLTKTHVNWVKEIPGTGRSQYDVLNNRRVSVLSITNLTAADRGTYKCIVDNGIEDGDSERVAISLSYAPVFDESVPEKVPISSIAGNVALAPTASLECIVHAHPRATVMWLDGNNSIISSDDESYYITQNASDTETISSTLSVTKFADPDLNKSTNGGPLSTFSCVASNSRGKSTKQIEVVLRGPPDTPTELFAHNVTDTSVTLSWTAAFNGGSDQTFIVQYRYSKSAQQSVEVTAEKNHVTINNLRPSEEYVFSVLSANTEGRSASSSAVRLRTRLGEDRSASVKIGTVHTSQIIVIGSVALVVLAIIVIASVLVYRRCRMPKQTYKPRTIETDCESLHTESNLSSRCSSAKSPEGNKSSEDSELIEMQGVGDCRKQLLDNEDGRSSCGSSAIVEGGRGTCFERSNSRLSDEVAMLNRGCRTLGGCTFSSFRGLSEPDVSPSRSLFDFRNKSAKYTPTITEEVYARNDYEPRYRVDAAPSDQFHTYSNSIRKSCSAEFQLSQPSRSGYESEYTAMNNPGLRSGTPTGEYQNFSQDRFGTPQFDTSRYYQSLKPQMLNGSPRHNGSPIARMNFDHPAARHDDGYATIRLPVGRNSPGSRSAVNGSGLYVRSIGHMADHNPGIASELDASACYSTTIEANASDFPPPPLEVIAESNPPATKQPCSEYGNGSSLPTDYSNRGEIHSRFNQDRSSNRRAITPSVRFNDELNTALTLKRRGNLSGRSDQTTQHDSTDDDTDSGCGTSADDQVHRVHDISPDKAACREPSQFSGNREIRL